jgi:broad specificity phosphatase PhoE
MVRIVLILPGTTDYGAQGRIQGCLNIPLNADGIREVARLADELRTLGVEVLYSSACEPCLETATTLATSLGLKLKKLDHMQNIDHGLWQGMLVDEVKHKQPKVYRQWQDQPESICPPEGETLVAAKQRVQAAIARLLKKHKHGVVGLVVPEPLASLVRVHLGQGELGDLWRANSEHGHWELITIQSKTVAHSG